MENNTVEKMKKDTMKKLIDKEHGINYHKNIDLSGYTVYRGGSFITFRFITVGENQRVVAFIDYIYVTNKKSLIKLLSWCINFWTGNGVQCIYYREHKRKANYIEKTFPLLDFNITESIKTNKWKHEWKSTNGFDENQILEAFVG